MSTRRSARQSVDIGVADRQSTMTFFIKNHASPEQLLRQIEGLYNAGQTDEARNVCDCIVDAYHPLIQNSDFFVLHAKILFEVSDSRDLVKAALEQALLIDPSNSSALELKNTLMAQRDLRDGLYEQGEASLRTLLNGQTLNAYALFVLAHHLLWKNGPESEAIELFERCLILRPHFLKARLDLAMAYKKAHLFAKADAAFLECLRLDANAENHPFYRQHLQSL
ncbi:hypothetical protein K2X05_11090 [bacterium]|nr:hypothetical protein [bacterium]